MKKVFLFIILIILSCSKEKNTIPNKVDTNILIENSENSNLSQSKRILYSNLALKNLIQSENSIINRKNLLRVAEQYYKFYESDKLGKVCRLSLQMSLKANDTIALARTYNYFGKYKTDLNQIDSAYYYFNKAERLFLYNNNDSIYIADNYLSKAYVEMQINDYSGCESSTIKALKFLNNSTSSKEKYDAYNYLGICSSELENFENSLTYYKKALEIVNNGELSNNSYNYSKIKNNIGHVYQNINNHQQAIVYFKEGLKEKSLLFENPGLYAMLTDNYAYSKFKLKDYNELPGLFYVSLKIREKNKLNQGIIISKIHLSEYFNYVKDTIQSRKFANEALQLAKRTKIPGDILASLKQLSNVDLKNVAKYSKEYIRLSDSVQNEERKAKDRFARIAYETDEVIQKNTELEVKNRNLVIFLFGTIVIFFLLYAVRTQKMRNRELAFKQEQQESNRQIYNLMITQQEKVDATSAYEKNRIAQELHDGILSKMFGTRMNLDSLNESTDNDSISMRYTYIQALKSIEQEIREISHDLSSEKGKLINNFVNIVMDLLTSQNGSFETNLVHSIDKTIHWERLDNTAKINLYRILQESLQNINKYAMAKTISVSFTQNNDHVVLRIEDDGVGFDLAKKKKGIGLKNMISRTEESNGNYEIISELGKGTVTTVKIPLNTLTPNQIE